MLVRTWFAALQVARTFDRLQRDWRRSPCRRHASFSYLPAEVLEVRSLLSSYTAASVSALIADINAANANGGANTITLAANTKFDLTAVNNFTNGLNGLPVISGKNGADNLTIVGTGATIERSFAVGSPFRLFDVASGNSLTLQSVTLQNGRAYGSGAAADGGGIFNQGALTLNGVNVLGNVATGRVLGGDAAGGGIYSSGALTLEGGTTVENNRAVGTPRLNGGNGFGGGLYVAGGTATLTNATLSSNSAVGSTVLPGGLAGNGFGGGLEVAGGTVTLSSDTLSSNVAQGAAFSADNANGGNGSGGALQVSGGTVSVRNSTLSLNTAQGGNGGSASSFTTFANGGNGGNGFGGALQVSGGTVGLTSDTLSSNVAAGGLGGNGLGGTVSAGGNGGNGLGGALQVSAGTVSVGNSTLSLNTAQGGDGGIGGFGTVDGSGFGGALEVNSGTLSLTGDTVSSNSARGSRLGRQTMGLGGGLYIPFGATVDIDAFTLAHVVNNTATSKGNNIYGTYIKI
jgi:hypothetical protein